MTSSRFSLAGRFQAFIFTLCLVQTVSSLFILNHTPLFSAYHANNDILITISTNPDRIHFTSTTQGKSLSTIDLVKLATSISVNNHSLAVGHDGYVSIVDFYDVLAPKLVSVYSTHVIANDVILSPKYVYILPGKVQWTSIVCVELSSGEITTSLNPYGGALGRLHPKQQAAYYITTGLSPQQMYKFSTNGTAKNAGQSPYWGDYSFGSKFWFSVDGTRIFTNSGNTFVSSTDPKSDMFYQGKFDQTTNLLWIDQSSATDQNVVGIVDSGSALRIFKWPYLSTLRNIEIPPFFMTTRYVFFNKDGTSLWTVGSSDDIYIVVEIPL